MLVPLYLRMLKEFTIKEIWIIKENKNLFADMYMIDSSEAIKYCNSEFTFQNFIPDLSNYTETNKLYAPLTIIDIREHEDLDNKFILTHTGDILRFNTTDGPGGIIFEEFTIERKDNNPESYYHTILSWYKEGNILNIKTRKPNNS